MEANSEKVDATPLALKMKRDHRPRNARSTALDSAKGKQMMLCLGLEWVASAADTLISA